MELQTKEPTLWNDQDIKTHRLARVQKLLNLYGIGGLFIGKGVGVRYVLNVEVPGGRLFVPAKGDAIGLVRSRDLEYVRSHHENVRPPRYDTRRYSQDPDAEETGGWAKEILDLMREHGIHNEPLGVLNVAPAILIDLIHHGVHVIDATQLLDQAEAVKSDGEVAIYDAIASQYESTIEAFRQACLPGTSENGLAGTVVHAWYECGGEDIAQLNVCSGELMNPWRRWPTQRKLAEGDLVGIDLHGRGIGGLRGDVSRTFLVGGNPSPDQRALYRAAYEYLQGAIPAFRAGRSFAEVAALMPAVPKPYQKQQAKYHIAHGVGMGSSGYPHIDQGDAPADRELEQNQIVSIECYFGEVGSPLAVKLEEMVLVQPDGPRVLGPSIPWDQHLLT